MLKKINKITSNKWIEFKSPAMLKSCAEYSHNERFGSSVPSIFCVKCSSISLSKKPYLSRDKSGVFVPNLKLNSAIYSIGPLIDFSTQCGSLSNKIKKRSMNLIKLLANSLT